MISAQLVKQLRELTDAGMMDCKNALVESNGDLQKAIAILREKGLNRAAKKAGRVASEGVVAMKISPDSKRAVLVEINSETDFVAKNDLFKAFVARTLDFIYENSISNVEILESSKIDGAIFQEYLHSQIAKIGENIKIRRIINLQSKDDSVVGGYVHNGRVGALVEVGFKSASSRDKVASFAHEIAIHIAAMKPESISYEGFSDDFISKEKVAIKAELEKVNEEHTRLGKQLVVIPEYVSRKEITPEVLRAKEDELKNALREQKKPEAIWDKILPGQLERFLVDNTLLDQRMTLLGQFFVMDDKKTVLAALNELASNLGDNLEVVNYVRFELGEGIEKQENDFAAEVASQMS